jgi:dTDP-4-dehydrorhamnose reductase
VTAHAIRHVLPHLRHNNLTPSGIYHVAASGETSWHGYARFVLQQAQAAGVALQAGPGQVDAVPTTSYPTPARRPLNSRLDTTLFQNTFGLHLPPWQQGVTRMLTETL